MAFKDSVLLLLAISVFRSEHGRIATATVPSRHGGFVVAFAPSSVMRDLSVSKMKSKVTRAGVTSYDNHPIEPMDNLNPSTTAVSQSKNEYALDLSHYTDLRAFNLMLEDIAVECTSSTYKKSGSVDVISRATVAEALVTKLEQETSDGTAPFQPDVVTYNSLMKVWARASQTLAEGKGRGDVHAVFDAMEDIPEELTHGGVYTAKDAADRAAEILENLEARFLTGESDIAPNTFGYNIVLDGYHKCGASDAAAKLGELFETMKRRSKKGVKSPLDENGEKVYVNGDVSQWTQVAPDAITYSIYMETLGQSRDKSALNQVEELLESIESAWEESKDENLKPVTRVANSAMNAYLKHGARALRGPGSASNRSWVYAKKVHEILNGCNRKYKETGDVSFRPDITTYTMVIEAYGRCYDAAATERGEYLFRHVNKLWKSSGDDNLKPSSRTFTVMINSWAKSRDPQSTEKVEELITMMEDMYEEDRKNGNAKKSSVRPSIRTYTAAMGAWVRSRDNTKPQRALRILKKVSDMYKVSGDEGIKPTLFTYNVAIDACAMCNGNSEQQNAALKIAFAVNKAITASKLEPNQITYSTLIKAAGRLLPQGEQRREVVTAVFKKSQDKGYVDTNVIKALEQAADRTTFYNLMEVACDRNGHFHQENMPKEWTKNVYHKG